MKNMNYPNNNRLGKDKPKGKQPYIPLYIGDWEQDTNCLSLEAEGACLKLIFKLWKQQEKGKLEISFSQMQILFKKSAEETQKIFQELAENKIFNLERIDENKVMIVSRRMRREAELGSIRSNAGKASATARKTKPQQNINKPATKAQQNFDNEIEYGNENGSEKLKLKNAKTVLVKEMQKLFCNQNALYTPDARDFKPLYSIAIFLTKKGQLNGQPENNRDKILPAWEFLSRLIAQHSFYGNKSLSTISNHIQELIQTMNDGNSGNQKRKADGASELLEEQKLEKLKAMHH
jgi:uncharacterized protein YdaU (DUF1376 family)